MHAYIPEERPAVHLERHEKQYLRLQTTNEPRDPGTFPKVVTCLPYFDRPLNQIQIGSWPAARREPASLTVAATPEVEASCLSSLAAEQLRGCAEDKKSSILGPQEVLPLLITTAAVETSQAHCWPPADKQKILLAVAAFPEARSQRSIGSGDARQRCLRQCWGLADAQQHVANRGKPDRYLGVPIRTASLFLVYMRSE